jgi:hypothetical protein
MACTHHPRPLTAPRRPHERGVSGVVAVPVLRFSARAARQALAGYQTDTVESPTRGHGVGKSPVREEAARISEFYSLIWGKFLEN